MNILRRLSLSRLLLLCVVVLAVAIGATALALAVGAGPTPPPKPLAQALHDALGAPKPSGVTARVQLTNRLLEGANLASGGNGEAGQLSSSPLISGASGRLWVGSDGRARLELQSEKGDTQILWDGKTASMYDASTNTLYRYTPKETSADGATGTGDSAPSGSSSQTHPLPPSVSEIQEHIAHAEQHAVLSGAIPTDVAGQSAYTLRVSPREDGGLIAGAEVSWDAVHGNPLRAAIYSTSSSAPAIELAASEISYGQPESSALEFTPPANAKVENVELPEGGSKAPSGTSEDREKPQLSVHGKGLGAIVLAQSPVKSGGESLPSELEQLQQVDINGAKASELPTQLGTLLTFERAGVRYLLVGSVTPSAIEAFARSL